MHYSRLCKTVLLFTSLYLFLPLYLAYLFLPLPTSPYFSLLLSTSLYLSTSPYLFLPLPTSPYLSLPLSTSPYLSLHLPTPLFHSTSAPTSLYIYLTPIPLSLTLTRDFITTASNTIYLSLFCQVIMELHSFPNRYIKTVMNNYLYLAHSRILIQKKGCLICIPESSKY